MPTFPPRTPAEPRPDRTTREDGTAESAAGAPVPAARVASGFSAHDAAVLDELGLDDPVEQAPVDPAELALHRVTAVLVAHQGLRWLPDALDALERSRRAPDRVVGVDSGSTDGSDALLAERLGSLVRVPPETGFGAAVAAGLAASPAVRAPAAEAGERVEWVWLLHDDCAPAPDALESLLELAVRRPDAAVLGPKVREWRAHGRQLLEMGITLTGAGRRHTGLERREYDQGQHDAVREVLAVGSAGMLVRRDLWDRLGGFDPALPIFRDDVDFCWRANAAGHVVLVCPGALVHHAEAAAHGRRRLGTTRARAHLVDRRNALYVLLANSGSRWTFPLVVLRVVVGSLLRALGFLLGKQPAIAAEEMRALGSVLAAPRRLLAARRQRAATRTVSPRRLRRLFPGFGVQMRQATDTLRGVVSGTASGQDVAGARRRMGGSFGDEDDLEPDVPLFRGLVRGEAVLVAALALAALFAARSMLGGGRLMGGALLPAQDGAGGLWDSYVASWHAVGIGSATPAPPYLAVVGFLGALLAGSASLAVDLLLLAAVPLAGLTAWVALRGVTVSRVLRLLVAAVWAFVPATTGAIAAGRLGTAVLAVLLPLLLRAGVRAVHDPRLEAGERPPLHRAFGAGLLLAVVVAFTPVLWPMAVVAGVLASALVRSLAALIRVAVVLALPVVLLLPWTLHVAGTPSLLLVEAGLPGPGLSEPRVPGWQLALAAPGGPGTAPVWLYAGVLLAAAAALAAASRRRLVLLAWCLALLGLAAATVLARTAVTAPTLQTPVVAWPAPGVVVALAGLLLAGVVAAEAVPVRLAADSFSWRQPVAVLLGAAVLVVPLVAGLWWVVRGSGDPLDRRDPSVVPAYVADEAARPDHPRTVVLRRAADGRVRYALIRGSGPRLGDAETSPSLADSAALDEVLGDLLSGRGSDAVQRLSHFAVRYVYLPGPVAGSAEQVLDATPGLVRASAPEGSAMWRLDAVSSRVRTVAADGTEAPIPSQRVDVAADLPAGPDGRVLLLAEQSDGGWRASLDGVPLAPRTVDGWAQGFVLPAQGGRLVVEHSGGSRAGWLLAELVLVGAAAVFALPGIRRDRSSVGDALELDAPDDEQLGGPAEEEPAPVVAADPFTPTALLGAGRGFRGRRAKRTGRAARRRAAPLSAEDWLTAGEVPGERRPEDGAEDGPVDGPGDGPGDGPVDGPVHHPAASSDTAAATPDATAGDGDVPRTAAVSGRRWSVAVLVALSAVIVVAGLLPAPAQTAPQRRPGHSEPLAAASASCPWVGGEPGLTSTVSAMTLPAGALPAAGGQAPGPGLVRVERLAGTEPGGAAAKPLLRLRARGAAGSAPVESARATGVAAYGSGSLAPGMVAEASMRGSRAGAVRGLAAAPCTVPSTQAWFVGPSGQVGSRARLVLANPADVPAVASLRVWDEQGPVEAPGAADLGIPARGERSVTLDALAPGARRLAVQVVSGAGRVSAAVQIREVAGLDATGLSWVPPTAAPSRRIVVAGVPGVGERTLFVVAPGERDAVVSLRLLGPRGAFAPEGRDAMTVPAGTVKALDMGASAGADPVAVELSSDVAVTAGVRVERSTAHGLPDFAYTAASGVLDGAAATFVPGGGLGSTLLLSAPGPAGKARLRWLDAAGGTVTDSTVAVAAGATRAVGLHPPSRAAGGSLVVSSVAAGSPLAAVRLTAGTGDGGALLDLVPLNSPPTVVQVPKVAQDLSTGLSGGGAQPR